MTRPAPIIAGICAVILLLFSAYMLAYYANLERASFMFGVGVNDAVGVVGVNDDASVVKLFPAYRMKNRTVNSLFWPANQLDRRIRPAYWSRQ